jgi:hypothetical protein
MWGRHYESMYDGSMYGAGLSVFAVWGYVIAHAWKGKGVVELNPRKLADTLGAKVEEIEKAIEKLMRADPNSRHKEHEGRRLIKEGEFQYLVPTWKWYQSIRNQDERRESNRVAQSKYREKLQQRKKFTPVVTGGVGSLAEREAVKAMGETID